MKFGQNLDYPTLSQNFERHTAVLRNEPRRLYNRSRRDKNATLQKLWREDGLNLGLGDFPTEDLFEPVVPLSIYSVKSGSWYTGKRLDALEQFYQRPFVGAALDARRVAFLQFLEADI